MNSLGSAPLPEALRNSGRPVLCVDLDNTVYGEAGVFVAATNEKFGTEVDPSHYSEDLPGMWKVSRAEADRRVRWFHASGIIADLEPLPGAVEAIGELSEVYAVAPLTSRQWPYREFTRASLRRHFRDTVTAPLFTGFYGGDTQLVSATKADILRALRARGIIDDMAKHCVARTTGNVVQLGDWRRDIDPGFHTPAMLFGDYPWNRTGEKLPEDVIRVANWEEVLGLHAEHFLGRERAA